MKSCRITTPILTGLALAIVATPATAQLDPDNADDAFKMSTKIFCSLKKGEYAVYWWEGTVYSRIRGEKDRHLFNVQGMNIRQCQPFADKVRGVGSRSVSREVMFFADPETGEVMHTWNNPWTGEEVEIIHVANDPVNSRAPSWSRDEEGKPTARFRMRVLDDVAFQRGGAARLFYTNPMAGDYQEYVGNNYHASEFLTAAVPMDDLTNADATRVQDSVISWGRISGWLPWMKMRSRDGLLVFYTGGMRLNNWDELPEVMKNEIRANYPAYTAPPPVTDDRPNETTWTVVKKTIDAERADQNTKEK
jgi:hypothetical protein